MVLILTRADVYLHVKQPQVKFTFSNEYF